MEFIKESSRIYAKDAEGKVVAEVTFPVEEAVATIDHTFVDDSLRGQGIAGQLVKMAADTILADGLQIAATCPYAVAWFGKHLEYHLTGTDGAVACKIGGRR